MKKEKSVHRFYFYASRKGKNQRMRKEKRIMYTNRRKLKIMIVKLASVCP